jgi:cellulose/xylan binding protein with CBM9 domain
MRSAPLGLKTAIPLCVLLLACVEQDEDKPTAEDLAVAKQNILTTPPTPKYPVNADLDGKAIYLGLDVDHVPIEPGKDIQLTHYWKMVASHVGDWKTFTHLNGGNSKNFINADHAPVKGKYPVSAWKAGEIIRDQHTVRLPVGWSQATVEVYVGLWRGQTRMPIKAGPHDAEGRVLAASIPVSAKPAGSEARKRYVARMVTKAPKIDGKLDEAAWTSAPSTGAFVNTMTGAAVAQVTEAKLLWDKKYLYIGIENADSDVWAKLDKRDDKLWTEEADEIMIDADGNGRTYVELQVAPNGNLFDTYLPERRRYEDAVDPKLKPFSWNSKTIAKVRVDGTLNKREDQDKSWTAEIAIPLEDVKGMDSKSTLTLPPTAGNVWRINMFRMDVPQGKPQQAAGWSPPMVGDFHALDRFGELAFGDAQGAVPPPAPVAVATPAPAREKSGGPSASTASAPADRKATAAAKGGGGAGKKK